MTFRPQFQDICEETLDVLQQVQDGTTMDANQLERLMKSYNFMVTEWQSQGMHLWTYTEGRLFLQLGQSEYNLAQTDPNAYDYARITNNPVNNRLSVAAPAASTDLTVYDGSRYEIGQNVGIVQNDRDMFWSTITNVAGQVITINNPLPLGAPMNAVVVAYAGEFLPMSRLWNCRRWDGSQSREIEILNIDRKTYFDLPDKIEVSSPVQVYFSRQSTGLGEGSKFYIWPLTVDASFAINFTYEREIKTVSQAEDYLDFPRYWYSAIAYNLADRVKAKFGASPELSNEISLKAQQTLLGALGYDNAQTPFQLNIGV